MARYRLLSNETFRARDFDEHLREHDGMLDIILTGPDNRDIICRFEYPLAFRKIDEGNALRTLGTFGPAKLGGLVYLAEDSDFARWFADNSCDIHKGAKHYCLTTINSLIDIISKELPQFLRDGVQISVLMEPEGG